MGESWGCRLVCAARGTTGGYLDVCHYIHEELEQLVRIDAHVWGKGRNLVQADNLLHDEGIRVYHLLEVGFSLGSVIRLDDDRQERVEQDEECNQLWGGARVTDWWWSVGEKSWAPGRARFGGGSF